MAKTRRPIIFWAWKNRPSFVMRGVQISQALAQYGISSELRLGPSRLALWGVKESIVVCVKSCPRLASWLRRSGNRIVYDAIDFTALRGLPSHADAVIAGTDHMRGLLKTRLNGQTVVQTIYHHADPQLQPHTAGEEVLRLAYNGAPESSRFIKGEIPQLDIVSFEKGHDWRDQIRSYNAHFSARMDPSKSVIKLANASVLGAIFLTGPEPGCQELLGKDYPFFLRDPESLEKVREDVRNLESAVGSASWKEAKSRIAQTRERLTLDASARAYSDLFTQIS